MQTWEAITSRRNVRARADRPVPVAGPGPDTRGRMLAGALYPWREEILDRTVAVFPTAVKD